jgi:hypothetical protein
MTRSLALALLLLGLSLSLSSADSVGPGDFPPGCGVLTEVREGEMCGSIA